MPLSQAEIQKIQSHFQTAGIRPVCHACGANNWSFGEIVAIPGISTGGATVLGGPIVPMVQVVCGRCGYVMHLAAKIIGLVP